MPRITITCQDCGTKRRNCAHASTKRCEPCGLLNNLEFLQSSNAGSGERECSCGEAFLPIALSSRECGVCSNSNFTTGTCKLCLAEDVGIYRASVPICWLCLFDPAERKRIIVGLRKGRADRAATNGHVRAGETTKQLRARAKARKHANSSSPTS